MKFPILGLMVAVVLGQYGLMATSSNLVIAFIEPEMKIETARISSGVFCRSGGYANWSCPRG
ncbi:MAG: hypothetical protein AB8B94_06205 [Hyphomicrobiales bacterium]